MGEAKRRKQLDSRGFGKLSTIHIGRKRMVINPLKFEAYFSDPQLFGWIKEMLPDIVKGMPDNKIRQSLNYMKSEILKQKDPNRAYVLYLIDFSTKPLMGITLIGGRLWVNSSFPSVPPDSEIVGSRPWLELEKHIPNWHKSVWD